MGKGAEDKRDQTRTELSRPDQTRPDQQKEEKAAGSGNGPRLGLDDGRKCEPARESERANERSDFLVLVGVNLTR